MIKGFQDAAEEGGTAVTGGQMVVNPWIIIGGVATVVCQPGEFICLTEIAVVGDVLMLTKPSEPRVASVPTNGWII